jgi:hypothetical protein
MRERRGIHVPLDEPVISPAAIYDSHLLKTISDRRMTRTRILSALVSLGIAVFSLHAAAADKPRNVKYVPPEGFAGHKWGDLRSTFDRLPSEPIGVGAAWMRALEKQNDFTCVPVATPGPQISGAVGGCDFQATLLRLRTNFEGGGYYVLSDYTIDGQGFRFGDEADGVVLHPVIYEFCANWNQGRKKQTPPPNFDSLNQFCGVRFMFQSETREQLRKLPDDYVTNYDRMVDKLLAKFGKPDGYLRRGKVLIETLEGDSQDVADRKFSILRWCPAKDTGLHTSCTASVVLSLDPTTGVGTVLYSTPVLWEFAYARENYGFKGDKLYRMLHAKG